MKFKNKLATPKNNVALLTNAPVLKLNNPSRCRKFTV